MSSLYLHCVHPITGKELGSQSGLEWCVTAQFHGRVFFLVRGRVNSSTISVPAKILPCERFQTRKDICKEKFREICGDVQITRCKLQSNTLLVYASALKSSTMELRELQTRGRERGRGRVYSSLYPGKYSAMELGSKVPESLSS